MKVHSVSSIYLITFCFLAVFNKEINWQWSLASSRKLFWN